jgi:hypothetical protein
MLCPYIGLARPVPGMLQIAPARVVQDTVPFSALLVVPHADNPLQEHRRVGVTLDPACCWIAIRTRWAGGVRVSMVPPSWSLSRVEAVEQLARKQNRIPTCPCSRPSSWARPRRPPCPPTPRAAPEPRSSSIWSSRSSCSPLTWRKALDATRPVYKTNDAGEPVRVMQPVHVRRDWFEDAAGTALGLC